MRRSGGVRIEPRQASIECDGAAVPDGSCHQPCDCTSEHATPHRRSIVSYGEMELDSHARHEPVHGFHEHRRRLVKIVTTASDHRLRGPRFWRPARSGRLLDVYLENRKSSGDLTTTRLIEGEGVPHPRT
jgi:hypothetical protein